MSIPGWDELPNIARLTIPVPNGLCGICRRTLTNPHITECGHIFCKSCLLQWFWQSVHNDSKNEEAEIVCPDCIETLYVQELTEPTRLGFFYIQEIIARSGLLDGTFTAGAGLDIGNTSSTQWQRDVVEAIAGLDRGAWSLVDSPCTIDPIESARDIVMFGNIVREHFLYSQPDFRDSLFTSRWDAIVTGFADAVLHDWPQLHSTEREITRWLEHAIDEQTPRVDPSDVQRWQVLSGEVVDYVVARGVTRSLYSWTRHNFATHDS